MSAGNPNVAETRGASIKQIIVINQDQTNHNGGDIHFGPNDGYLYVGMGDGGSGGDPGCRAQHINNLLGNMLRLDVDTPGDLAAYEIPDDNPFDDETWAYGLRNPWRWSFDRFTGDLFIGDVGQVTREEISFQPAGSPGGENYGWKVMEGNYCHDPNPIDPSCPGGTPSCGSGSYTPPLFDYTRSLGQAVAGGFRYRGSKLSGFHGTYVYGDHSTGRIWFANQNSQGQWSTSVWMDTNYSISSFGEDEEGELYLAHKTGSGKIYRFESAGSVFTDGFEAGDTSVWSEDNP